MDSIMNGISVSKIAMLNDEFRKSGFGVTLTCGVQTVQDLLELLKKIREFNNFSKDNDPYGEHDFGRLDWYGDKVFWKIDYYNDKLTCFEDPLSSTCKRVMTVMLVEEY